jgi:cystathionine gamma-synthase
MAPTNGTVPQSGPNYSADTLAVHADDYLNTHTDVAPALHVSTTYRYSNDAETLAPVGDEEVGFITILKQEH